MGPRTKLSAGRQRLAEPKGRKLTVRVSEAEYAAVEAAANSAGQTTSAFFRSLVLDGAGVRPVFNNEDRAALQLLHEDMRKIGINLNQVARALNAGRVVHPEEVLIAIRNVQLATTAVSVELRNAARRSGNARRGQHE